MALTVRHRVYSKAGKKLAYQNRRCGTGLTGIDELVYTQDVKEVVLVMESGNRNRYTRGPEVRDEVDRELTAREKIMLDWNDLLEKLVDKKRSFSKGSFWNWYR